MTLDVGFFVSRFYNQQKEIDLNSLHSDAKFSKWYAPVIESLYKMGGSGKRPDVHQKIIKDYGITDDELKVVNSTGNAQVLNDIDWLAIIWFMKVFLIKVRMVYGHLRSWGKNS